MGKKLAVELQSQGVEIVVIDQDSDAINEASQAGLGWVSGDAREEETLSEVGVSNVSTLVSTFPNDVEFVFITLAARDLNKKIRIIARVELESTEKNCCKPRLIRLSCRPSSVHDRGSV
ncbi:MAG: hypothetical protein CMM01_07510 [Rhodopirellula sp.]|nr:hypothetical protein [Rhodopirellula sp.]OUX51719.1 MAG: hypothetical protein CBE43_02715 [Rhodopirellula sp. TMED283]